MKRFLILGAIAVAFAAAATQPASAWINSNFGIGMNWSWQSGGNSLLCGLWRDGQPCGADFYHQAIPVYPRPCCCQAPVVQTVQPQVCCPPAPAPVPVPACPPGANGHHGHGGPVGAQAFRYTYRPYYPAYYYGR